jgi:hypothetical protein
MNPIESGENYEAAAPSEVVSDTPQQEQYVPLDALKAERAERQRLEDQVKNLNDQFAILAAATQNKAPPQEKIDLMSDDDVLTVGEAKKHLQQMQQNMAMSIAELKMTQQHPDYQDVITKYLPEVLKTNPGLQKTLQSTQDFELAYYLAKNSEGYKKANSQTKRNEDAERILQNSQRAGNLSSIGQSSAISAAKSYKSMSDDEFKAIANKNLGYF